jgi:DHA2 family methylenomycin A resistance protein-like MFS transporter
MSPEDSGFAYRLSAAAAPEAPSQPSRLDKALTLTALSLGFCVVQLDVTIVNVALNAIGASFDGSGVAGLQWVVNAYTLAFAALILSAGALGDRIGAKRVFLGGFLLFTVASLGCAAAPTLELLIAARVVQGMGAAVLVPSSLALLNHSYPDPQERTRAVAIWAAGASFALTAGPLVGGALIATVGWRSIFLVNLPIGLIGLGLTWRYARETSKRTGRELDLVGQASAIAALGTLAAALIEGGAVGWTHPLVLGCFAASVLSFGIFLAIERRTEQPMLPLSLFADRAFSVSTALGLLVNAAFYGLIFVLSLFFQRAEHLDALTTGLAFLPMMGAILLANLVAAQVAKRLGARLTIAGGTALMAIGCAPLLALTPETSTMLVVSAFVALGGGLGFVVPPLTSTLLGSVDKTRSGVASGVLNSMRQTGSVVGVALFGSLIAGNGLLPGTHSALAISAALSVASCLAALMLR